MAVYNNPFASVKMNRTATSALLFPPLQRALSRRSLNKDRILQAAAAIEPLGNFEADENFEALLESLLSEAQLTPAGIKRVHQDLIATVVKRRQLNAYLDKHPQVLTQVIKDPIVITGLPRSGTALLHKLFGADNKVRTLQLWELRSPCLADVWKIEDAIQETQAYIDENKTLSPDMKGLIPSFGVT